LPTSAEVPIQVCKLLGITMLAPFCGLGLCQTQTRSLFNTFVGSLQGVNNNNPSMFHFPPSLYSSQVWDAQVSHEGAPFIMALPTAPPRNTDRGSLIHVGPKVFWQGCVTWGQVWDFPPVDSYWHSNSFRVCGVADFGFSELDAQPILICSFSIFFLINCSHSLKVERWANHHNHGTHTCWLWDCETGSLCRHNERTSNFHKH
jgi:hypothetical protein